VSIERLKNPMASHGITTQETTIAAIVQKSTKKTRAGRAVQIWESEVLAV
jgi:hypothetical protein